MGIKQSQFSLDFHSRLHRAVSRRDEKTTRYLLEKAKVDINHIEDGHCPLNVALYRRHDAIVALLINAGCRLDPGVDCTVSPLQQAVYMCHLRYITLLLDNGCDINHCDKEGKSALHIAISTKTGESTSLDIVDLLIKRGININAVDESGCTALHMCCMKNRAEEARRLIATPGCDLNIQTERHETPLIVATKDGHEQLVHLLVEAGCDIDIPDGHGMTAVMRAFSISQYSIAEILLENGANKNVINMDGMTALHIAAQVTDRRAVECLLTIGSEKSCIDVNLKDRHCRTPLLLAAASGTLLGTGHSDALFVLEMLLEKGADPKACNMEGRSALHQAANYGRLPACERLLAAGADVLMEDRTGKTPLLKASGEGHTEVVRLLIQHNSKVNHRDAQGRTALYLAAEQGRTDTMHVLLKGALMDVADKEGNAPIHRTVRFPSLHPGALWTLIENGCDPINLDHFLAWILHNEILAKNVLFAGTGLEEWYSIQKRNPDTLRHICRLELHKILGITQRHVPRIKVGQLPLPSSLLDYVSLKLL